MSSFWASTDTLYGGSVFVVYTRPLYPFFDWVVWIGARTVAATNAIATNAQAFAAASLFSASDPESDPVVAYQLFDATTDPASGHWVVNGVDQAAYTII